ELCELVLGDGAVLERGQRARDRQVVLRRGFEVRRALGELRPAGLRARAQVLAYPRPTERHPVVGVVDALDAVTLQLVDLLRRDRPAAAPEHADVLGATV